MFNFAVMDDQSMMDHRQAWRHFYDSMRPGIWANLSLNDRRDINTAERDYQERRINPKTGVAFKLGAERVARLLDRFAPGRYGVERVVRFWVKG